MVSWDPQAIAGFMLLQKEQMWANTQHQMGVEPASLTGVNLVESDVRVAKALEHFKATCPYASSNYPVQTIRKALLQRIHVAVEAKQNTVDLIAKCCTIPSCPEMALQRILVRALCGVDMDGGKPAAQPAAQPVAQP